MADGSGPVTARIRVLLVADSGDGAASMESLLKGAGIPGVDSARVGSVEEGLRELASGGYEAVLLQRTLGGAVERALQAIREVAPPVPVVVFSDTHDEQDGVDSLRCGAADYVALDALNGWTLTRLLAHLIGEGRTAARLAESEQRVRTLFECAEFAMMLVNGQGVIGAVNRAAEALLGCSRLQMEGKAAFVDLFEVDAADFAALVERQRPFAPVDMGTRVPSCSRNGKLVRLTVSGVPDSRDVMVVLQDASEGMQTESELKRQKGFFRSLFENSPEGIVAFDVDGRIVDVNPAFERLFGYERGSIMGKDVVDVVVPSRLADGARHELQRSLDGTNLIRETVRRRATGAEVPVSILGAPVILDGVRVGGFGIYRDESDQKAAQERLQEAFIDLVETISRAIESVDPYTAMHQRRVARLADMVGRSLGLDDDKLQGLYVGSMLHDIGKLSLPSTILTKPGKLTREEWNLVRSHSRRGFDILAEANLPWPVAEMALRHHERVDGSGYPDGVSQELLSLELRILGVCDVVEAMTSDRPYRPALSVEAVLKELREGAGNRYDTRVVEAVMGVVDSGEFLLNSGYKNEFA